MIAFHCVPDPSYDGTPRRPRGPINLFYDVCGGHLARFDAPIGEVTGGLMPRYLGPRYLSLPRHERFAVTCEWVAELIEEAADVRVAGPDDGDRAEAWMKKVAGLLGGDTTTKVLAVAADRTLTSDQKMRAIYALNNEYLGRDSPWWAELLGVSPAAIRDNEWWKVDRKRLRAENRGD